MAANPVEFEQALELALRLSPLDKIRLVERLAATLGKDISPRSEPSTGISVDADTAPSWTDEERHDLMNMKPITPAELVAWLDANPPAERWDNLRDDADAAEYVHQMRRNTWSTAEDALVGDHE